MGPPFIERAIYKISQIAKYLKFPVHSFNLKENYKMCHDATQCPFLWHLVDTA